MADANDQADEIIYLGSSQKDLSDFPPEVIRNMARALEMAARGEQHMDTKMLQGFGGGTTLEVVQNHRGDTYRVAYTVRFPGYVFVLHAFKKKSHEGRKTPQRDREMIEHRMQWAQQMYRDFEKGKNP